MAKKRSGLGRGLSALIPTNIEQNSSRQDNQVKDVVSSEVTGQREFPVKDRRDNTKSVAASRPSDVFFHGSTDLHEKGGPAKALLSPKPKKSKKNVSRETITGQLKRSDKPSSISGRKSSIADPVSQAEKELNLRNDSNRLKNSQHENKSVKEKLSPNEALSPGNSQGDNVSRETQPLVPVPGAKLVELSLVKIEANRKQPRQIFDQDELEELAESIKQVGVLQPIIVRQLSELSDTYELVMGERRFRAAKIAGLATIPAIVRQVGSDNMLREALLENLHRVELNPLEEAAAYQQLMEDFGCTQVQLSKHIARSRSQIANTIRLLRLPGEVQARVAAGVISAGHARALLGLSDQQEQSYLAERIVAEGLSVRSTEEIVALGNVRGSRGRGSNSGKGKTKTLIPEHYQRVAEQWTEALETRVSIRPGKKSSKLVIDFADQDDLE